MIPADTMKPYTNLPKRLNSEATTLSTISGPRVLGSYGYSLVDREHGDAAEGAVGVLVFELLENKVAPKVRAFLQVDAGGLVEAPLGAQAIRPLHDTYGWKRGLRELAAWSIQPRKSINVYPMSHSSPAGVESRHCTGDCAYLCYKHAKTAVMSSVPLNARPRYWVVASRHSAYPVLGRLLL